MIKRISKLLAASLLVVLPQISNAGVWEERAALERYVNQVELLNKTILQEARNSADPNSRIQMDYDRLLFDSQEILNKIKHQMNSPLQTYKVDKIRNQMNEKESVNESE